MLDGNVTALVTGGGDLILRGDNLGNGALIQPGPNPGEYVVTGTNLGGAGLPTTINGGTEPVPLSGVRDDFKIYGYRGDDDFRFDGEPDNPLLIPDDAQVYGSSGDDEIRFTDNVTVGDDLKIYGSSGNDLIVVNESIMGGDLYINTSSGNDIVNVTGSTVGAKLYCTTSSGADIVYIAGDLAPVPVGAAQEPVPTVGTDLTIYTSAQNDAVFLVGLFVGDDLTVTTSSGDDSVGISGVHVVDRTNINTSSGNDSVGIGEQSIFGDDLRVSTGSGNDWLGIAQVFCQDDLALSTSSGADVIGLTGVEVAKRFTLYSGSGNDQIGIAADLTPFIVDPPYEIPITDFGLKADYAKISTSSGNDLVVVLDSTIQTKAYVSLSSGNDILVIRNNTVNGKAYLNGGSGTDTTGELAAVDNTFAEFSIKYFELFL